MMSDAPAHGWSLKALPEMSSQQFSLLERIAGDAHRDFCSGTPEIIFTI